MLIAVFTILSSPPTGRLRSSVESMEFPAKKFTKKTKFLKKKGLTKTTPHAIIQTERERNTKQTKKGTDINETLFI